MSSPDPTALCVSILGKGLERVEVSSEMPPDDMPSRPAEAHVQVSQTGGDDSAFLARPIMTLECRAPSDALASALATDCIELLREAAEDDDHLSAVETLSKSRDQWARTGAARYEAQVRLTINKD